MKANVEDDTGRALDDEIISAVRDHRDEPGYSDEYIDVFDFAQKNLDDGYWAICPPEEVSLLQKLKEKRDSPLSGVVDSAFAGTQTSANKIFIVVPTDADRIEADETGGKVRVVPIGEEKEYAVEKDLLKPWLQGRDIERWRGDWSGQHVISPYQQESSGEVTLISADDIQENQPMTWDFFEEHRESLEGREGGRFEGRDDWYSFGYPKSMERFEKPKLVGAEIASEATFMLDEKGTWYFKTGYGIQLASEYREKTQEFAALLNSNIADFCLKHISSIKAGGYYKYTTHYLENIPVKWVNDQNQSKIAEPLKQIVDTFDTENRIDRFPEAYLGDYDGPLGYIDYEWQTRRYPVNADIQELADGRFAVTAGRSDEITDPLMDRGDREENKRRAKYVHAAVDGRNMKKGEEQAIPIPKTGEGVKQLLDSLEADRQTVEETSIEELEAEIDEAVYDLFDLTEDERRVIEEYLDVF